ncbi:MAG: amidohydrolase family protein [Phycisphaerales bacterium]
MATPLRPARLREAHAHLLMHGEAMDAVQLADCTSADDLLARMAARADATPSDRNESGGVWIVGVGARPEAWASPAWPSLARFDEAVRGRPAIAWCFDTHALLASSAALRAAGIDRATPDPEGGVILRTTDGSPTGVVLESAAKQVAAARPSPTSEQRLASLRAALADLKAHGFVEVHDLKARPTLGPDLARLSDAGELDMDVRLYVPFEELESALDAAEDWTRENVRLAGAKLFADGTLNSRTAWMLEPFADPIPGHERGTPLVTPEQLLAAVGVCDDLGVPLAVHAIGDGAVRAVLDAIERVRPSTLGFRVEHAELIDEADVPRFAALGVLCSVQPCHLLYDIEALRRLLPGRLDRVMPLRELIESGCEPGHLLWFGSDVPIVRPHPEDSIRAAVHRRREGMPEAAAIAPDQAIEEADAWAAFEAL